MAETHRFDLRVYYEDTDAGGIVYYANYLKFIERARTEWLRERGVDQSALRDDHGLIFVVARVEARYRRSARLDDQLTVQTRLDGAGGPRMTVIQDVYRGDERLFEGAVDIVLITVESGRPARAPEALTAALTP